jgi:DNA-binding NtrC family response regulator
MMNNQEFDDLKRPIAVVVDDEPFILMDTSDIISDAGYSIVEATTADEAYGFLNEHSSVQLVFTDVQTPGAIDGFELERIVASRWPDICVVVVSGAAVPVPGDLPENAEFIAKPFSAETVLEVLRERCPHHPKKT